MPFLCLTYIDDDKDKKLFEDVYRSYRKQMVVCAITVLGNEADAEDAVSDVFLRIAQKNWGVVRNIENETDLRNYLLRATKNTCLNKIKSRKKENAFLDKVIKYEAEDIDNLSDDAFIEFICDKYEYEKVVEAIKSLDEKYRDVLYYHYVLEMTAPQAAKALNQNLSTTKQQLVRGKKMLLSLLGKKGDEHNSNE